MTIIQLQAEDYVRFSYRIENGVKEFGGYVDTTPRNGQFVLSDSSGNNPERFEQCAVVKWFSVPTKKRKVKS